MTERGLGLDKVIESGFRSQGPTELSRILQSVRPFELRLFSAQNHTLDSLALIKEAHPEFHMMLSRLEQNTVWGLALESFAGDFSLTRFPKHEDT